MVQLTDRAVNDDGAPPLATEFRPLARPVLIAGVLTALLALWIRAEPVEITRALQVGLGALPAIFFGAVVWYVHQTER